MSGALHPGSFQLHPCAEAGCRALAFGARCEKHETEADRVALRALDRALLDAAEAEEQWREARVRVTDAEQAAGVRRAG